MVRALFDTNIVLDFLLRRPPWVDEANRLFDAVERGDVTGYISASALTDIFYIARKSIGSALARSAVERCLGNFIIITVDESLVRDALTLPIDDLEDALQVACASREGLDAIVTRDAEGFVLSPIPAFSPVAFLTQLGLPAAPNPQTP